MDYGWLFIIIAFIAGVGLEYILEKEFDVVNILLLSTFVFFIMSGTFRINFMYNSIMMIVLAACIIIIIFKKKGGGSIIEE